MNCEKPQKKMTVVNCLLTSSERRKLQKLAEKEGRSARAQVRAIVLDALS